jgi:hypothetical protein
MKILNDNQVVEVKEEKNMAPFEQNPAVLSHLTKRKRLIPQC